LNPMYFNWWWEQQLTRTLHPVLLLAGFGLFGFIAFIVSFRVLRRHSPFSFESVLLVSWTMVSFFGYFLPIPNARRLIVGWQIPVVLLSLLYLRTQSLSRQRILIAVFAVLTVLSLGTFVVQEYNVLKTDPQNYLQQDQYQSMLWLKDRERTPTVVLSLAFAGNYLPAVAEQKVVWGMPGETIRSAEKWQEVIRFFSSDDDGFRRQLLQKYKISYVYVGRDERENLLFSLDGTTYLQRVYRNGTVDLYRVQL
jgi:hypothetical protein